MGLDFLNGTYMKEHGEDSKLIVVVESWTVPKLLPCPVVEMALAPTKLIPKYEQRGP